MNSLRSRTNAYGILLVCLFSGLIPFAPALSLEEGYVPLYNEKDLLNWDGDAALWTALDQMIVGNSAGIKHNQFLVTRQEFGDFELKLEFRLRDGIGNSGIQFRSARIENSSEVSGYQADIGENYWGCLYDESRRNKVLAHAPSELQSGLKKNDWNEYTIRAVGENITLKINGLTTVDYRELDAAIPRKGVIGLQVHSGGPLRVEFRKIRIKSLD